MRHSKKSTRTAIFSAIALSGTLTTLAVASPPTNFQDEVLVGGSLEDLARVNSDRIKFTTKDSTDTAVIRVTYGAGGKSGWHHHQGMVLVQVAQGLVKVSDSSCASRTYGPGAANGSVFVEGDSVHETSSDAGAVAYATLIVEGQDPPVFRDDDTVPFCAAQ